MTNSTQISLWNENDKRQSFLDNVPVEKIVISVLNPRKRRTDAHIDAIAELIKDNGFDKTCAPKAIAVNGHYEVFAGGNRSLAAKRAGCESIPLYLFDGYTENEIWKLAYLDNEQAGKHNAISVVDTWLDYLEQNQKGKSQDDIAIALKISQRTASYRIQYAKFPEKILEAFSTNDFLKEGHARELLDLAQCAKLSPWLTRESAMIHVFESVLSKTKTPTAQQFKSEVDKWNDVIKAVTEHANSLESWSIPFLSELSFRQAKTKAEVQSCLNLITGQRADEAREAEDTARRKTSEVERKRVDLEKQEERARKQEEILSKLVLGDSREQMVNAPDNIRLLLTDPPYGKEYQSNRRVAQTKAPKLANDDEAAFDLLRDVLTIAYPKMTADSFALVWTDWKFYCQFKTIIEDCGFLVKSVIVWNKPNHGSGDLEGTPGPKHEWCIFAVKGNPKLNFRFDNVLNGNQFLGTDHPTEKPLDLLETLIQATTMEGDCVVDPFFGGGSVPFVAHKLNRDFWACELDATWHSQATERIFDVLSK